MTWAIVDKTMPDDMKDRLCTAVHRCSGWPDAEPTISTTSNTLLVPIAATSPAMARLTCRWGWATNTRIRTIPASSATLSARRRSAASTASMQIACRAGAGRTARGDGQLAAGYPVRRQVSSGAVSLAAAIRQTSSRDGQSHHRIVGAGLIGRTFRSARDQVQRRARIHAVIRQLLSEAGIRKVTLRRIAEESGFAVQTVYNLAGPRHVAIRDAISDMRSQVAAIAAVDVRDPLALPQIVAVWFEEVAPGRNSCARSTSSTFPVRVPSTTSIATG